MTGYTLIIYFLVFIHYLFRVIISRQIYWFLKFLAMCISYRNDVEMWCVNTSILSSNLLYYLNHHINICICDWLVNTADLLFFAPTSPVSSLTPSSETSEDLDHQEIQLALQSAKMAARNKIRSRFHSSSDLIHRLFVCISGLTFQSVLATLPYHFVPPMMLYRVVTGVADQLQTNYASDLRSILKTLFEVMATKVEQGDNDKQKKGKNTSAHTQSGFWRRKSRTLDI